MWTLETPVAPCPFCGKTNILALHVSGLMSMLQCANPRCQAQGPVRQTEAAAVQAWQTRGPLSPRPCPQCGTLFQPRTQRHVYHDAICQAAAFRRARTQARQAHRLAQRQIEQEQHREEARRQREETRARQVREKTQDAWALVSS